MNLEGEIWCSDMYANGRTEEWLIEWGLGTGVAWPCLCVECDM